MRRKKTFEMEYNYFEEGAKVTPTKESSLMKGTYIVIACVEPKILGDECLVYVKGHPNAINAEHMEELDDHQKFFQERKR